MDKPNVQPATRQNRVTVRYEDANGKSLNEDLSLFGAEGSNYHINIPKFNGYWLTDASAPVNGRFPSGKRLMITLTYTKLGRIELYRGGTRSETIELHVQPDDPSRIQPLHLPDLPERMNYYLRVGGSYHLIMTPKDFTPKMPEAITRIEIMTAEAADAKSNELQVDEPAEESKNAALADAEDVKPKPAEVQPAAAKNHDIQQLLARALNQQAAVLDSETLTSGRQQQLLTNMQAFLHAIKLFSPEK